MTAKRPTVYPLPLIGWKEDVGLPQFGHGLLQAKIDTGARSAALHAESISVSGRRVEFVLRFGEHRRHCEARLQEVKRIKSSNGQSELRPVIETEVAIGEHHFTATITLTDRADMGVPMLLGREAMKGRFLVHPGRSFLISHKKARA